jgi:hypothetical protein
MTKTIRDHCDRNGSGRDWCGDAVDRLGNRGSRSKHIILLLRDRTQRLRLGRSRDDVLARIRTSDSRCAKRRYHERDRASCRPTGQAREPARCFHEHSMRPILLRSNDVNRFQPAKNCANPAKGNVPGATGLDAPSLLHYGDRLPPPVSRKWPQPIPISAVLPAGARR